MAKSASNGKQGFLSKFTSSFAAIPCGIIIIIFGCIMLWNNEKDYVVDKKDVKEMRELVTDVKSDNVDSKKDGKLIATSGTLDYGTENLVDEMFGISLSTPILERKVEVYAWYEIKKDEDTPADYDRKWVEIDKIEDSAKFEKPAGHENPIKTDYTISSKTFRVKSLKVGAFTLADNFIDKLKVEDDKLLVPQPTVTLPEGYAVNGNYITNSVDFSKPEVKDVRISYLYGEYDRVSILGKQDGSSIVSYTTAKNSSKAEMFKGTMDSTKMLSNIEESNKRRVWIFRIVWTILVCVGTSMLLSPLTTLLGYIPFLGKIVNGTLGVVSFLVGFAISIVVMGIAWLVFYPLIGIIFIAVAVGSIVLAKMYLSKKDDGKKPEVKEETKTEENKEEN
ncbi:MAG: TMEM43 family protein [Bacilli bacterium]|nr:TMEM43 family protein [Bacilli bacterium]